MISTVVVQVVLSLIIGPIFDSPNTTSALSQRGAVIFFAVLMSALITINETAFTLTAFTNCQISKIALILCYLTRTAFWPIYG
jgi:hypothetical protein